MRTALPRSLDPWVGRVCKVVRSLSQKRALPLQTGVLTPQPDQLLRVASPLVTRTVLSHPTRQQALGNPKLLADLRLRQLRIQRKRNGLLLELGFALATLVHDRRFLLHSRLC